MRIDSKGSRGKARRPVRRLTNIRRSHAGQRGRVHWKRKVVSARHILTIELTGFLDELNMDVREESQIPQRFGARMTWEVSSSTGKIKSCHY